MTNTNTKGTDNKMRKSIAKRKTSITTREQLEITLGQFAEVTLKHEALKNEMEERIRQIREEYETRFVDLDTESKALLQEMDGWADENPGEFKTKKSLDLVHGTIGYRTGMPRVTLPRGVKEDEVVAELLKTEDGDKFIRVKSELDKDRIINVFTGEDFIEKFFTAKLGEIGIKVSQTERFFVEIKREGVQA